MLKKIRITVSVLLFSLITLYFLDFAGFLPESIGVLTDIQFIPALLALDVVVLVALIIITLIFGRVYCSSVCPMGIYQDIVAWLSKKLKKKKRYTYSRAKTILRWSILGATLVAFLSVYFSTRTPRSIRCLRAVCNASFPPCLPCRKQFIGNCFYIVQQL